MEKEMPVGWMAISLPSPRIPGGRFGPGRDSQDCEVDRSSREYIVGAKEGAEALSREICRDCLGMNPELVDMKPRIVIMLLKMRLDQRSISARLESMVGV